MMRIGARAHDYGKQDAFSLASRLAADGFTTVQLAPVKAISGINSFSDITPDVLADTKHAFERANIAIDVLGCYVELGAADEDERLACVDHFLTGIDHALALGSQFIASETTNFSGSEKEREARYERLLEGVSRIAKKAENAGVTACIEPVFLHTLNTAKLARKMLDTIRSPHLKIVFDPVNMLTVDNLHDQSRIFDEYFELLGADIAVVHVKDVDDQLLWCNLGNGIVRYNTLIPRLRALNRDFPLLREHVRPDSAHIDTDAMRNWIGAASFDKEMNQ